MLLCICVEHSDYWRAVSCCDTHPDVQQPFKASPRVCQVEGERKCVCVCWSMCICLSLQVVERRGCRSIIISCSSSPNSDSPQTHTNTCAAALKNQSIPLVTLRCSPNYSDSPKLKAIQTHTRTHTKKPQTKALTHAQKVQTQKCMRLI